MGSSRILTVNSGSSSVKMALYEMGGQETLLLGVEIDGIGKPRGQCHITTAGDRTSIDIAEHVPDQSKAFNLAWQELHERSLDQKIDAISHRIVHGGPDYSEPQLVTPKLVERLRALIPIDPDHLPQAIIDLGEAGRRMPGVAQVVCFDTAFHRTMPRVAQLCAIPLRYFDQGIRRYGFHGISYEYILSELRKSDATLADGRLVVAHLGSGASMAAIRSGRCLDTTMGFTPTSGLLMSTRTGDLDPSVLVHLLATEKRMDAEKLNRLINRESGLLGISGMSASMEDLLAQEQNDSRAADAVALFCYRAKKYLSSYAAVLGGLDALIFTAGIGEHSAAIRERICQGLEFLGIRLDPAHNQSNAQVISSDQSRLQVRVMKTNENLMLARHAARLLDQQFHATHHG